MDNKDNTTNVHPIKSKTPPAIPKQWKLRHNIDQLAQIGEYLGDEMPKDIDLASAQSALFSAIRLQANLIK